ncbi:hypothetical protein AVEN_266096-1 [Araneus ventricosus]|uniref:Uncharacterized protein n=1 Tax=Araneus ventricosus TaxID=182803 RepID=A0A4Y2RGI9_ARAVE|nr:hypothetical protein AVEN_266096-1 [Araneus ventricosus]
MKTQEVISEDLSWIFMGRGCSTPFRGLLTGPCHFLAHQFRWVIHGSDHANRNAITYGYPDALGYCASPRLTPILILPPPRVVFDFYFLVSEVYKEKALQSSKNSNSRF